MDREDVPEGKKRLKDGRLVSAAYGGRRDGAGRPPKTSAASIESISQQLASSTHPTPTTTRNAAAASSQSSSQQSQRPATFFLPHNTHRAVPGASNTAGGHTASQGNADLGQNDASRMRSESHSTAQGTVPGVLSQQALHRLTSELAFVGENDVHGDIASGLDEIDDSLVDELIPDRHSDDNNAETSEESEATEAFNRQYLQTVKRRLLKEIKKHGKPDCYTHGQLVDRPVDPVFALMEASTTNFGPNTLYHCDVFVWLPDLLTGHRDKFKCHCGKQLSNHGYPDKPIARRVNCIPDYYFLFTNRFWCDSDPGCGQSFLGTDPHIIGQTPQFVQERFPAYISTRGAVDKDLIMWPQTSGIVKRLGPAPFSEMVSELQYKCHARKELMYYSAALHFGLHDKEQVPSFSAFNDSAGFAGCPPSTSYLKGMYTDYIGAHRIYMDRAQAALPLDIAKANHTFDFLKYMGGIKGEKIWKAAYNVVNQWDEVRAESLTLTKSLFFVSGMLKDIQDSLKAVGHPPTAFLYTDSPQFEQGFHEAVTESLSKGVQHVTTWTDLSPFELSDVSVEFVNDSMMMEDLAAEILEEATGIIGAGNVYVMGLAVKFCPAGVHDERAQIDVIQVQTHNWVVVFKVTALNA